MTFEGIPLRRPAPTDAGITTEFYRQLAAMLEKDAEHPPTATEYLSLMEEAVRRIPKAGKIYLRRRLYQRLKNLANSRQRRGRWRVRPRHRGLR